MFACPHEYLIYLQDTFFFGEMISAKSEIIRKFPNSKKSPYQKLPEGKFSSFYNNYLSNKYGVVEKQYTSMEFFFSQDVVDYYSSHVLFYLPEQIKQEIINKMSFGSIMNSDYAAFIIKESKSGYLATLITSELITYIKYFVLTSLAPMYPQCFSLNSQPISSCEAIKLHEQFKKTQREAHDNFDINSNSEEFAHLSLSMMPILEVVYEFIILHEIGHYINGDLVEENFKKTAFHHELDEFAVENHQNEFFADEFAYNHIVRYRPGDFSGEYANVLYLLIYYLFNTIVYRDLSENSSHPHPFERIKHLLNIYKASPEYDAGNYNKMLHDIEQNFQAIKHE